jgi:glycosyltransferase involved in cell wall biosynthesis
MLRILQVGHDLNIGGLQRVVMDLAHAQRQQGHDAHICSLRGHGPLAAEAEAKGIPVHAMPWPERGPDRFMFLKVRKLLAQGAYDVIHTHNTQAFMDGGLGALLAGTKTRIHTDHARSFPDRKAYMIAERVFSMTYDKVVAVSGHTLRNLASYEGIAESRMTVIPNGINGGAYRSARAAADRAALRKREGLDGFSHVFGLGVRLEDQKGITYLLSAMPEILRAFPKAGLAIAGDGSLLGALKAQAAELGVAANVVFLGARANLIQFYCLLDFFVLPSLWEGMPLCILEAMCLGLPVVATSVGGVPEFLTPGKDGLLVPPREPEALAKAILAILGDEALARSMGEAAARRFDTRFDYMRMAEDYLALYAACGAKPRARAGQAPLPAGRPSP